MVVGRLGSGGWRGGGAGGGGRCGCGRRARRLQVTRRDCGDRAPCARATAGCSSCRFRFSLAFASGLFLCCFPRPFCVFCLFQLFASVSSFVSALSWGLLFLVPPSGRGGFFLSCAFAFAAVLLVWRGGGAFGRGPGWVGEWHCGMGVALGPGASLWRCVCATPGAIGGLRGCRHVLVLPLGGCGVACV